MTWRNEFRKLNALHYKVILLVLFFSPEIFSDKNTTDAKWMQCILVHPSTSVIQIQYKPFYILQWRWQTGCLEMKFKAIHWNICGNNLFLGHRLFWTVDYCDWQCINRSVSILNQPAICKSCNNKTNRVNELYENCQKKNPKQYRICVWIIRLYDVS